LFAEFYVSIHQALQKTLKRRAVLREKGLQLWESVPTADRYKFLVENHQAMAVGFRQALVSSFKTELTQLLGFGESDFAHILQSTPGNPDITGSFGGTSTPNGNVIVGPTITVKESHVELTFGAGPEVDYKKPKDDLLSGGGIRQA